MSSERLDKAELALQRAKRNIDSTLLDINRSRKIETKEPKIWDGYSDVEYACVLLKLHVNVDNPGRLYPKGQRLGDPTENLKLASSEIHDALSKLRHRKSSDSLEAARRASRALRKVLAAVRRDRSK